MNTYNKCHSEQQRGISARHNISCRDPSATPLDDTTFCAQKQNGFTLVELAIALMVIGLLIGGVLKGQELIENAKITRIVKDTNDYDAAVMIFQSIYNALPGDINRPTRIPNCTSAPCNEAGNADHAFQGWPSPIDEQKNFWIHLSYAGLIGPVDETKNNLVISPLNAFGGNFVIRTRSASTETGANPPAEHPMLNMYIISDTNTGENYGDRLACHYIAALDRKMDDGKPLSGTLKVYVNRYDSQQCYSTATQEYLHSKIRTFSLFASNSLN